MPMLDDDLLLLINGWWEELEFTLPAAGPWRPALDTFHGTIETAASPTGTTVRVGARSVALLVRERAH
jgi:pullulanase/glycogen debranching enzyme